MIEEFRLPDVGEGVAEGELVEWHVEPGETVVEDQIVAEVETDKALVEVPSPYNGTVAELLAEEGEIVPVGDVIITFDVPDEEGADAEDGPELGREAEPESTAGTGSAETTDEPAETTDEPADRHEPDARVFAPPSVRRLAREEGVDLATVDGSGPGGRITEGDVRASAAAAGGADEAADADEADDGPASVSFGGRSATARGEKGDSDDAASTPVAGAEPAGRERTLAAPATRKLAREEGVDIDDVPASDARAGEAFVTPDDVRGYAEAQQAAQAADAAAVSSGETKEAGDGAAATSAETGATADLPETVDTEPAGTGDERIPYRGIRRTIGERMQQSKFTAPHATHHDTAVVEELVTLRAELKPHAEERGVSLTYMPLVMQAVVKALKEHPKLNAVFDAAAEEVVRRGEYHLGVAVATDAGLMVPVVRDVDRKGAVEIASELGGLVERAREREIAREEMQGSTFTLTNFGAIGGEYATPIINYPEVAILGLGAIEQRPVVENGEVVARHTLPLSLSIDHRVVDGADAGRFANALIEYLENPRLLVL